MKGVITDSVSTGKRNVPLLGIDPIGSNTVDKEITAQPKVVIFSSCAHTN